MAEKNFNNQKEDKDSKDDKATTFAPRGFK